jgi:hypothetical protein
VEDKDNSIQEHMDLKIPLKHILVFQKVQGQAEDIDLDCSSSHKAQQKWHFVLMSVLCERRDV